MHKVNQECYALVFKALLVEPQTAQALAELSGLSLLTTRDLMRTLKKHKVVHISGWEQDCRGRDMIAVFALGEGRDKARFKLSTAERRRRYVAKQKRKLQAAPIDNLLTGGLHAVLRDKPPPSAA